MGSGGAGGSGSVRRDKAQASRRRQVMRMMPAGRGKLFFFSGGGGGGWNDLWFLHDRSSWRFDHARNLLPRRRKGGKRVEGVRGPLCSWLMTALVRVPQARSALLVLRASVVLEYFFFPFLPRRWKVQSIEMKTHFSFFLFPPKQHENTKKRTQKQKARMNRKKASKIDTSHLQILKFERVHPKMPKQSDRGKVVLRAYAGRTRRAMVDLELPLAPEDGRRSRPVGRWPFNLNPCFFTGVDV